MKENVIMTSFYCLVGKFWKKITFYIVIKK